MSEDIKTVADLIAVLSKLDPDAKVAQYGDGGTITPINEVRFDTFHVNKNDRTFATCGRHINNGVLGDLCTVQEGMVAVIV